MSKLVLLLHCLAVLSLAGFLGNMSGAAQVLTGSITGRVVDAQGAAVPSATITLRNTDVNSVRMLKSGPDGSFRAGGLSSGAYAVEGVAGDLAGRRPVRVTVVLGSTNRIVLRLDVKAVKQSANVNAREANVEGNTVAPPSNAADTTVNSFLPGLTVTYLPNRDRDFTQFTDQAAGTEDDADGTGVIIAGQRSNAVAFEVDGTGFVNPLLGTRRGAEDEGVFLPLSAVREFQVVHSGVDTSVGDTGAGLINVATKAGANRAHSDAFYTGRPPQFTSADAFGNSLDNVQNAFGLGYGGPIRKNRSFYFLSAEQDFVQAPYSAMFAPQAPGTSVPAALATQQGEIRERQSPTALFGRLDLNLSASTTLNLELAYDREHRTNAGDGLARSLSSSSLAANYSGQSFTTRAGLTSLLNPHVLNDVVFAWSQDHRNRTPNSSAPEQFINGFGAIGGDSLGQHLFTSQQYQLDDGLTWMHGASEITFGGRFAVDPAYEQQEQNLNGRFDYNSLQAYLNSQPRRFQQTVATGDTVYRGAVREFAFYANAKAELHLHLYLTAGVRWAGQWNPQPTLTNPALSVTQRIPDDLAQWQPRIALSWEANAKTVLRISSGLFSAPTPATFFHRVFADNGTQTVTADSYFDPSLFHADGREYVCPACPGRPSGRSRHTRGYRDGNRSGIPKPAFSRIFGECRPSSFIQAGGDRRLYPQRCMAPGARVG